MTRKHQCLRTESFGAVLSWAPPRLQARWPRRRSVAGALTQANTVAEFVAFREKQITFFAEMVKSADIRIE